MRKPKADPEIAVTIAQAPRLVQIVRAHRTQVETHPSLDDARRIYTLSVLDALLRDLLKEEPSGSDGI